MRFDTFNHYMFDGDMVTLFFNVKNKLFGYKKKNKENVIFNGIKSSVDIRYRLFMQIYQQDQVLTLLHFEISYS